MLREMSAAFELPRLLLSLPELAQLPRGDGKPVMVLPGFGASDLSTTPLRRWLRARGFEARGWGLGINGGDVDALLPRVTAEVVRTAETQGEPVRLVGWSLGGVLAREVARDRPDAVGCVVTLGSPVVGGPKYTLVGRRYAALGYSLDAIEATVAERHRTPIQVPVTAVFSKNDGIVAWQACIDPWTPHVEHVEVRTSHLGFGLDPDVYRIVAERMATSRPARA
jgi:pimeloyl-ACP methyl ester carboxylesterase